MAEATGERGQQGGRVWVFHSGALGDHVMIWPVLRAIGRRSGRVMLVARHSHRRVAEAELGIDGEDIDHPRFSVLWKVEPRRGEITPVAGVGRVVSFLADAGTMEGRQWILNAMAMFPGATIDCIGPPGTATRTALWREVDAAVAGAAPAAERHRGPIVLHAGAGSASKRWRVERWLELIKRLRGVAGTKGSEIRLIAGHVEHEGFTPKQAGAFEAAGGVYIDDDLPALTDLLRSVRLVICGDSGPGHLAAQLGVATLSLFGPTDWRVWSPVGPRVRVITPPSSRPMEWLSVDRVADEVAAMLTADDLHGSAGT